MSYFFKLKIILENKKFKEDNKFIASNTGNSNSRTDSKEYESKYDIDKEDSNKQNSLRYLQNTESYLNSIIFIFS